MKDEFDGGEARKRSEQDDDLYNDPAYKDYFDDDREGPAETDSESAERDGARRSKDRRADGRPKRGPGRKRPSPKEHAGEAPRYEDPFLYEDDYSPKTGHDDPESEYDQRLKEWGKRSPRQEISPQEAWERKRKEFLEGITMISPFFLLASILCLLPEYFVWKIHFEQWQKVYDFEPSLMTLTALLAFGTVASMAVSWHLVIECWQNKRRTGRIGGALLAVTAMMILTFASLFTFESMAFYEFMRADTLDIWGDPVPGKSHMAALTSIGSWGGLNFVIGFVTGFCTSHITSKE